MQKIVTEVFKANDGTVFTTEKECTAYENKLKSLHVFRVTYEVDLTETGIMQQQGFILVNVKEDYNAEKFAEYFCFKKFGNRIDFVQGVFGSNAICEAWTLYEVEMPDNLPEEKVLARIQPKFDQPLWDMKDPKVMTQLNYNWNIK